MTPASTQSGLRLMVASSCAHPAGLTTAPPKSIGNRLQSCLANVAPHALRSRLRARLSARPWMLGHLRRAAHVSANFQLAAPTANRD